MARRLIALRFVALDAAFAQDAWIIKRWRKDMSATEWRRLCAVTRRSQQDRMRTARRWKSALSPRERAFLLAREMPIIPEREIIDMSWRCESLGVMAWALRFHTHLPPLHRTNLVSVDDLNKFMGNRPDPFMHWARLRPRRELEYAREVAAGRVRRERGKQAVEPPFRWDVIAVARLGREYYGDEFSPAVAIARERLHALNWLCGYAPGNRWDDTPADIEVNPRVTSRPIPRQTTARQPMPNPAREPRMRPRRIAVATEEI